jgi:hypothetical protein
MHQPIKHRFLAAIAFAAVLALAIVISGVPPATTAGAQTSDRVPVTIAQLAGPWSVSLIGNTGCGWSSFLVTFTLDANGSGMATNHSHTSGCGDGVSTGIAFVVQTVNPDGSGKANLSCGPSCGWEFVIQVARNREMFSVVDVDPANPGNFLSGVAIRQ